MPLTSLILAGYQRCQQDARSDEPVPSPTRGDAQLLSPVESVIGSLFEFVEFRCNPRSSLQSLLRLFHDVVHDLADGLVLEIRIFCSVDMSSFRGPWRIR